MAKKSVLTWLWAACLLLLPANTALCQAEFVPDAPTTAPAGNYRPAYFTQLKGLQERLTRQEPAAALQHTVIPGDSLTAIATRYGVSVAALAAANNLQNPNLIYPGQVLSIPVTGTAGDTAPAPLVHEVKKGDTVWGLAKLYQVGMDEILAANNITAPEKLEAGQKLVIPGGRPPAATTRVIASRTSSRQETISTPAFTWPVSGRITSGFGPRWGGFHYGLDLAAPAGSPVKAIFSGTVTVAGWVGSYGYMVCIDHQNGWESVYGHNAKLHVTVGQTVQKGQTIASVGQTGNATGPHVHLETIYLGRHQNPLKFLPARRE